MQFEIGVVRKQSVAASLPPRTIAQSAAFASRIAGRSVPGRFTVLRAELALAYEIPAQVNYFQTAMLDIAPSVTVHDHYVFPGIPLQEAAQAGSARAFGEAQASALFERLFSRHQRVAAFPENGGFARPTEPSPSLGMRSNPSSSEPAPGIVERVLASYKAPEPAEAQPGRNPAAGTATADPGWGSRPILPAAQKPFALPQPEVKRVAEQVIREIDHRLTAQRERMGRR